MGPFAFCLAKYARTAALAPVRYPVVVGVIAFGLLNPDPVYAPTFQTTPTNRPTVLTPVQIPPTVTPQQTFLNPKLY